MKIIDAEKVKFAIDAIIEALQKSFNPNPLGTTEEMLADAEITALELVKSTIDNMKGEENKIVEWLKSQKEVIGVSFQEDFIERFKQAMKEY